MTIIALEGLDKSGKHSTAEFIQGLMETKGKSCIHIEFPRYDSPYGELIRQYLTGQMEMDKRVFELLQSADKLDVQANLDELIESYDFVIIDRYVHTQLVYGLYNNPYEKEWLYSLTKGIRKPDYVLYLDVDPAISMSRKGQHGDNDKYESDLNLLQGVHALFKEVLSDEHDSRVTIIDANQSIEKVLIDATKYVNSTFFK